VPTVNKLAAYERDLTKRYRLEKFFEQNKEFLLLIPEIRKSMDKWYRDVTQTEFSRSDCFGLAQVFLERSDKFLSYVNNIHANEIKKFENIPIEDWKFICELASRVMVQMGWEYDSK